MMRMRRFALGILITLALSACDQKELCFDHDAHAGNLVDFDVFYNRQWQISLPGTVDWREVWNSFDFGMPYSSLYPEVPSGLRVLVYDDESFVSQYNIASDGGDVNITEEGNSVLLFNNDTEYIIYSGLDSISDAMASTRSVQRSSYQGSPYVRNAPRLVNPPDVLYNMFVDEVGEDFNEYDVRVVMQPVVFSYLVRYHFAHGLQYVAISRGALAGMASDVWLESGVTGDEAATVLFDCELADGLIQAVVKSFGVPSLSPDQTYGLNLEVRLKNGKILDFDFDVTSQIVSQPKGGVIEVYGVDIPDDVGKEDPGVFDVSVEGWGEFEDIPVSF